MTHFNILTGVNRIFDDLKAFSLSVLVCGHVCVCVRAFAYDCTYVCLFAIEEAVS